MEALLVLLQYSKWQLCWCCRSAASESIVGAVEVLLSIALLVLLRYGWKQCCVVEVLQKIRGSIVGVVEVLEVVVLLLLLAVAML